MKYTWDRRDYEPASYFCDGIWMEDKAVCDRLNEQDTALAALHARIEGLRRGLDRIVNPGEAEYQRGARPWRNNERRPDQARTMYRPTPGGDRPRSRAVGRGLF